MRRGSTRAQRASGQRVTGWRAAALWTVVVADLVAMIPFAIYAPSDYVAASVVIGVLFGTVIGAFGVVGAILITRLPRNPFGWIYLVAATLMAWSLLGVTVVAVVAGTSTGPVSPAVAVVAIVANLNLIPIVGMVGIFVPLLFPTGRPPTVRWRPVVWLGIGSIAWMTIVTAVAPGVLSGGASIENPIGIAAIAPISGILLAAGTAGLVVSFVLAAASVVIRFRGASAIERQQLRWFAASVLVMGACVVVGISSLGPMAEAGWIVMIVGLGLVPIGTGIAILRYRLYDIDRIISRSIGWALITGLLVAVFAVGVVALQAALAGFTQGETLAVAASTLLAFALFQPLRRRVQRAVDRRFDRARYDAERTAITFADRLRHETDIDTVATELSATTRAALAPSAVGIWLRPSSPSP